METALLESSSDDQPSNISSFSLSSSSSPQTVVDIHEEISRKYDVFLNFRGEDTRKNILGHLRAALSEKGIKTFVDDDQIERGQYISPQLVEAIENSSCSVVIFSPNYASSSWCLDEIVKILECMRTRGQVVIPVFYQVDPSHVRKQVGNFGEAFAKHEKNLLLEGSLERVIRWRVALTEVTSLAGLDLQNYRYERIIIFVRLYYWLFLVLI